MATLLEAGLLSHFNSFFIFFLPLYLLSLAFGYYHLQPIGLEYINFSLSPIIGGISLFDIFISVFVIDYILTIIIGLVNKKPQYLFYGIFFIFMHYITSLILVSSIVPGFFGKSSGRWTSPKRSAKN